MPGRTPESKDDNLSCRDRFLLRRAKFDGADRVLGCNDVRRPAILDRFNHVAQFADVTVGTVAGNGSRRLAIFKKLQLLGGSSEIIVHGGVLKIHRETHVEPKPGRHRPGSLRLHDWTVLELILRNHMIDGAAEPAVAGRKNTFRPAKTELNKIGVVHVQIEKCAAGFRAVEKILVP